MKHSRTNATVFLEEQCHYCGGGTFVLELLRRCVSCQGSWWHNARVEGRLPVGISNDDDLLSQLLKTAVVEPDSPDKHYVYVLEIDSDSRYDHYVGRSGHHPVRRLLEHVRGRYPAPSVKGHVIGLRSYEGPMTYQESIIREKTLFEELSQLDEYGNIAGGH